MFWISDSIAWKRGSSRDEAESLRDFLGREQLTMMSARAGLSMDTGAKVTYNGVEIGRGLTAYGHAEAAAIIGRKSSEIAAILGYLGRPELIHRDDMTLHRKGQ